MTLATAMMGGCSPDETAESDVKSTTPHILALSTYSASLGTPIDAYMANPPSLLAQKIELVFEGTFKRANGTEEKVSITQPTNRMDTSAIRWAAYGPFQNPFAPKNPDIGLFTGTVAVQVTKEDGTVTKDDAPLKVRFEVQPSIIVTELQPESAACDKPALRLIGGLRYRMKTTTIGIDATSIDYSVKTPRFAPAADGNPDFDRDQSGQVVHQETLIAHAVGDTTKGSTTPGSGDSTKDEVKEKEGILLPKVPDEIPNYGVIFAITAKDAAGHAVRSTFGMTAHRPVDIYYDGRYQLAQLYPPTPVSACMPGGQSGREVNYAETKEERTERQLRISLY
jgi:hypothetical protein